MLGLSTADVLSLSQLGAGVVALFAAAWVYRQGRRAVKAAEDRCARSATRQGERLGDLEREVALLQLRRRQTEYQLTAEGVGLPWWPPDGEPTRQPVDDPPPTRFLTEQERAQPPAVRR